MESRANPACHNTPQVPPHRLKGRLGSSLNVQPLPPHSQPKFLVFTLLGSGLAHDGEPGLREGLQLVPLGDLVTMGRQLDR